MFGIIVWRVNGMQNYFRCITVIQICIPDEIIVRVIILRRKLQYISHTFFKSRRMDKTPNKQNPREHQNQPKQPLLNAFLSKLSPACMQLIQNYLNQHPEPQTDDSKFDKIKLYHDLLIIAQFKKHEIGLKNKKIHVKDICKDVHSKIKKISQVTIKERIQKKLAHITVDDVIEHIRENLDFSFDSKRKLVGLQQALKREPSKKKNEKSTDFGFSESQKSSTKVDSHHIKTPHKLKPITLEQNQPQISFKFSKQITNNSPIKEILNDFQSFSEHDSDKETQIIFQSKDPENKDSYSQIQLSIHTQKSKENLITFQNLFLTQYNQSLSQQKHQTSKSNILPDSQPQQPSMTSITQITSAASTQHQNPKQQTNPQQNIYIFTQVFPKTETSDQSSQKFYGKKFKRENSMGQYYRDCGDDCGIRDYFGQSSEELNPQTNTISNQNTIKFNQSICNQHHSNQQDFSMNTYISPQINFQNIQINQIPEILNTSQQISKNQQLQQQHKNQQHEKQQQKHEKQQPKQQQHEQQHQESSIKSSLSESSQEYNNQENLQIIQKLLKQKDTQKIAELIAQKGENYISYLIYKIDPKMWAQLCQKSCEDK